MQLTVYTQINQFLYQNIKTNKKRKQNNNQNKRESGKGTF